MKRVLDLNLYLDKSLRELELSLINQQDDVHRSGILIAKIKNPNKVVGELFKRNIIVSARGEGMRISTSIFNNEEDIDRLVEVLREIL